MYLSICVLYTNDDDLMAWRMALPKTTAKHKVQIVALRTEQTAAVTEPELNVVGDTELLTGLVWRYNDFSEQFDFAYLRNTVDTYARGEWILHIDADERLTTPHGDLWAFLEALNETDAPASYVSVYGIMDGVNKSGRAERYINANMRLHRKSAGLKWDGICHETLDKSAYDLGAFADSEIMLFHLGYNQGPEVQKQKAERNAKLLVREYTRNKCARNWDYLVKTFGYLHNYKT
jgi:glycosyltransferase involved in cell wall biosynthesis